MKAHMADRIMRLERSVRVDLPPVFCIDGTEAPPALWNKGVTCAQAEGINETARGIRDMMAAPPPNRCIEDFDGEA